MSTIAVNAITDASGGNTASINGQTPTESNMAGRNRIINGDMRIDQRNAGASVSTTNAFVTDRWQALASAASKYTAQQNAGSVTPPAGFTNYLGATSISAYTVGAGETFALQQQIEALNFADLAWGTASAATVTLSFWVKSSLTGTFGGSLRNSVNDRSYPFSYTISTTGWEKKTVTIAGDTSGTWLTTNGTGIKVLFSIGSGATVSGTAGAWASTSYTNATGATSVVGTNGATFYITGVQLEAGSVATPFERRQYGQELALCQRYYNRTNQAIGVEGVALPGVTIDYCQLYVFPSTMRVAPTVTLSSFNDNGNMNASLVTDLSSRSVSLRGRTFNGVGSPSKASGFFNAPIQFSAEL